MGIVEPQRNANGTRGFTLIEMMIVISLMLILISIAVPMYTRAIVRAREAVLRQNLFTLRELIAQYTMDKQKSPQSLEDLVAAQYLRRIPVDPLSNQNDWLVDEEQDPTQPDRGISDVRSGFNGTSADGSAYSSW